MRYEQGSFSAEEIGLDIARRKPRDNRALNLLQLAIYIEALVENIECYLCYRT